MVERLRFLLAQLREWNGEGCVWMLRAALDYPADFDAVLLRAILLGAVEFEIDIYGDGDDTVIRLAPEAARL